MNTKHLRVVADNTRDTPPARFTPEDVAHVDLCLGGGTPEESRTADC